MAAISKKSNINQVIFFKEEQIDIHNFFHHNYFNIGTSHLKSLLYHRAILFRWFVCGKWFINFFINLIEGKGNMGKKTDWRNLLWQYKKRQLGVTQFSHLYPDFWQEVIASKFGTWGKSGKQEWDWQNWMALRFMVQ